MNEWMNEWMNECNSWINSLLLSNRLFIQELHLRGNVFTEPLLSNGRLLSCDWPAPEMWAVPTNEWMNPQNDWVFGICPSSGFKIIRKKTRRFGNWICFRPQVKGINIVGSISVGRWVLANCATLKMEAIRSSETSVNTRPTQCHFPEDDISHSHGCEILKTYMFINMFVC
jgi:hypothetical protein